MTNKKTFKFQLSTLVIIALIAMLSVACKNKVTASANLSAEAGTEEVIGGVETEEPSSGAGDITDNKEVTDNKDAADNENKGDADNKDIVDDKKAVYNEGVFYNKDFTATVKNGQITIEYKDLFGGQGPLVIKAEGKTTIKAKNSRYGFNFIIDGVKFLATDATPNYDTNGDLVSIVFSGYGQTKVVKFSKKAPVDNRNTINEGSFANADFKATVKNAQIAIEYKDAFGGQGPLVIKAEGKTPIKAKNSRVGFNFIVNGTKLLVTDATPNYDANGNLSSILFDSRYDGQKFTVKF